MSVNYKEKSFITFTKRQLDFPLAGEEKIATKPVLKT
jgi:hypothetical protein